MQLRETWYPILSPRTWLTTWAFSPLVHPVGTLLPAVQHG